MVDEDERAGERQEIEFDGKNMEAIWVILQFLDHRLSVVSRLCCPS